MSSLSNDQVRQAAETLAGLRRDGSTIPELPAEIRPGDFADGYRVQLALYDLVVTQTSAPVAKAPAMLKVGCTTPVTQQMLNVEEPIGGRLIADQVYSSGSSISMSRFNHQPLIECEFAFRIASPIEPEAPALDIDGLRAAVDAVAPALELVDNRFDQQLGIHGPSAVADNSMATAVVLGSPQLLGSEVDGSTLASRTVRLTTGDSTDGTLVAEGIGREVLGDPWNSLLWAVSHERRLGRQIVEGTWIITGSCAGAPPTPLDQLLTARFPGLGDVSVTILSEG